MFGKKTGLARALILAALVAGGLAAERSPAATGPTQGGMSWTGSTNEEATAGVYIYTSRVKAGESVPQIRVLGSMTVPAGKHELALKLSRYGGALVWGLAVDGGPEAAGRWEYTAFVSVGSWTEGQGEGVLKAGTSAEAASWSVGAEKVDVLVRVESKPGWRGERPAAKETPPLMDLSAAALRRRAKWGSPAVVETALFMLEQCAAQGPPGYWEDGLDMACEVAGAYELGEAGALMEWIYEKSPKRAVRDKALIGMARMGTMTPVVRKALADENSSSRYKAAAMLLRSGDRGAQDVALKAFEEYLDSLGGPNVQLGIRELIIRESDQAMVGRLGELARRKTGTARNNVTTAVDAINKSGGLGSMSDLWRAAEVETSTAADARFVAMELIGARGKMGDIPRLQTLKVPPQYSVYMIEQMVRVRESAVVRIKQRHWRGEE